MDERLQRWRLILGSKAEDSETISLNERQQGMDRVLDALYDPERKAGLGSTSPNVNRWLGDIRKYFPASVVQVMQKDAFERLGLARMLMEKELLQAVQPDVQLVATLLSLKKVIPAQTRETAREVVRKVVEQIEKKLANPLREAIWGALNRAVRSRRPRYNEIDWHLTIRKNLKYYREELKSIIPEHIVGHGRKGQALKKIILLLDQSGSMAGSVVYAGIFGAVMASIRSLKTHIVAFDTQVVDLSDRLPDPVELLFGVQLGGGTDINKALTYAETLIQQPADTILLLITDLYEGGNESELLRRAHRIRESGVQFVTLLSLSDQGTPAFDQNLATRFASIDIPAFACTPDQFPELMSRVLTGNGLTDWVSKLSTHA